MTRWIVLLIVIVFSVACNQALSTQPNPEPPPVVDPEPEPVPDPEPEPMPEPEPQDDPADYIHLDRVETIIYGRGGPGPKDAVGTSGLLHGATSIGWRSPLRASRCENSTWYLGYSNARDLVDFGFAGADLVQKGENRIIPILRSPNRRCNPNNIKYDPKFLKPDGTCARSEMRKERLKEYRSRLIPHMEEAYRIEGVAGRCRSTLQSLGARGYDRASGWCVALEELGATASVCPQ